MGTLGKTLKSTREKVSLTLKEVEVSTGISNAYLSQLENDKIKKPSANVLYKLATVYKIDLDVLLAASGIIENAVSKDSSITEFERAFAFYKDQFKTEDEQKEVLEFFKYFVFKKKNGSSSEK